MQRRISNIRRTPAHWIVNRSVSRMRRVSGVISYPSRARRRIHPTVCSQVKSAEPSTDNQTTDLTELSRTAMLPPFPGPVQQTLWRSFIVIGTGLHSGEMSCVRVRPAFAGEGRYFVRVPVGTIPDSVLPYEELEIDTSPSAKPDLDVEAETRRSELYLKYLEYKEREGYIGGFHEFVREYAKHRGLDLIWQKIVNKREEPVRKGENEIIIPARLDSVKETSNPHHTVLENFNGEQVESVEYLLAALEACGVDNARIEVEGNGEIPSIDGCAACWTNEIVRAGIAAANFASGDVMVRAAIKPVSLIRVQNDDAFILLIPSERMELTCGIDHSKEAHVIGRQWHSWCLQDHDCYFGETLSAAKGYATSKEALKEQMKKGFMKGIQENVMIIAEGDKWSAASELSFRNDEPVRHQLLELIGDLSLLNNRGMSGLPFGHIIAYKPTHALNYAFARQLVKECSNQYRRYSIEEALAPDENDEDARSRERKMQRPYRKQRKPRLFKRTREQLEQTDEQRLLRILLDLCRETREDLDQRIEGVIQSLQEFLDDEKLLECLIDCVVELPTKTVDYVALIAVMKLEYSELIEKLLMKIRDEFILALQDSVLLRSRILLRLLCAFIPWRIITPHSFLNLLNQIMEHVMNVLNTNEDPTGRSWQPWTDHLVHIILISLPWGGTTLLQGDLLQEWNQLFQNAQTYINDRPIQRDASLSPFVAPIKENDTAARSDSGGASFLNEVWNAIQELRSATDWTSQAIPTATSSLQNKLEAAEPFNLPEFGLPVSPPVWQETSLVIQRASILNKRYPARGGIHLLEAQITHPNSSEIERIIVEDYILDTFWIYQTSRTDCVRRITHQIPSPFPIFALVAQILFSQLLLLPRPPLEPVTYSAIIINLCKIPEDALSAFPRGLSACVREIFSRLTVLDPELNNRMMDWLSLHLSNLSFMWPWSKWKKVVEAPYHDPQRLFVKGVLRRLVDLSYLSRVQESLSTEDFHTLLPLEAKARTPEELFGAIKEADEMDVDGNNSHSEFNFRLKQLVQLIQQKSTIDDIQTNTGGYFTSNSEHIFDGLFCALLSCGDKNLTHTETMISRYFPLVESPVQQLGGESQGIMINAVFKVWKTSIHRSCLILQHLLHKGLIQGPYLMKWSFQRLAERLEGEEEDSVVDLWEIVQLVLNYGESVIKEAEKVKLDAMARVEQAKASAQDAAKRAAEAAEQVECGDTMRVGEMLSAINEANLSEAKAQQQVVEAEAQLHEINADGLNAALHIYNEILIKVYEGFAQLLQKAPGDGPEMENSRRVYYRVLARFRSFVVLFSEQSMTHLEQLEVIFSEDRVPEIVRKAVKSNLRLGLVENANEALFNASYFSKK
eukprot:g2134.t1